MLSHQLTATQALEFIRQKELSAVELLRSCLNQIAEQQANVEAWEYLNLNDAFQVAKKLNIAQTRGKWLKPLHGIPIGIKDTLATANMPTRWGTPIHANQQFDYDAAVVERLRLAGAIILGKTVTTEYAIARPGKTRNPHNLNHTPGASSSGSAAAVASNMVPVAIGTQMVGSILRPAAYCGIVGFKPSFGVISRYGPSSNTVLEPVTSAIIAQLPNVSAHFGRFHVTEISLRQQALDQFDNAPLLQAAQLLADAKVDVITWNGTSAGWLGFDADVHLCQEITNTTGIPSATSVLAIAEILRDRQIHDFALVTPYLDDVQERTIANFATEGFHCIAEQHLNLSVNFSFSEVTADQLTFMIRAVAEKQPKAIVTFCTNLWAAPLVDQLEQELGIPIFDTISAAVWKSLKIAGINPSVVKGWGRLFSESPQPALIQV